MRYVDYESTDYKSHIASLVAVVSAPGTCLIFIHIRSFGGGIIDIFSDE